MMQLIYLIMILITSCQKPNPDPLPPTPGPQPIPGPSYGAFKVIGKSVVIEGYVRDGSKFGVKEASQSFTQAVALLDK